MKFGIKQYMLGGSILAGLLMFQNCGKIGSPEEGVAPDTAANSSQSSSSAPAVSSSSKGGGQSSSSSVSPAAPVVPVAPVVSAPSPVIASPSPSPAPAAQPKTYNFVSGDKATCENQVKATFGFYATCSIGGGCAADGKAPSASDPSANPYQYGTCVYAPTGSASFSAGHNFVSSSGAACESSVVSSLGFQVSCSVGGGCAANGAVPSAKNASANPSYYGACISQTHDSTANSSLSAAFVAHLYPTIFLRTADQGGLQYWVNQYNSGAGCLSIARAFLTASDDTTRANAVAKGDSLDIQNYVTHLYFALYNRAPDTAGLNYWVGNIEQNVSANLPASETAFLNNSEFITYCTSLGLHY